MLSETDVASLTGLFKTAPEETRDNDKLLELYWNRAELKKEFAALRNEKYQLQDRVKHHEGAAARVQQKMDHLESLLLDREWVHNVVVFYQLRRLGMHCRVKLERFAEQIKQQREQRVHSKTMLSWKEERANAAATLESEIGQHRMQFQLLEDRLQSERHKYLTMGGIARLFRGRRLASGIQEIEKKIVSGKHRDGELLFALEGNNSLNPPNHEGLSTVEKRSINFMILSFAQQLYLHFAEDDLASLAKEADGKSVGAINYGSKRDCDALLTLLEKRWDSMEEATGFAETLRKRAKKIADRASFRHEDDAVPVPGTVATIFKIDANGVITKRDRNLLGENYFGVAKVLSR